MLMNLGLYRLKLDSMNYIYVARLYMPISILLGVVNNNYRLDLLSIKVAIHCVSFMGSTHMQTTHVIITG